jgi:hypothetical protein
VSKRVFLISSLFAVTTAVAALTPNEASAQLVPGPELPPSGPSPLLTGDSVMSDTGWIKMEHSRSHFASRSFAGKDFGIGYSAGFGLEAYDWDAAPNTIVVDCHTLHNVIVESAPAGPWNRIGGNCPVMPGELVSSVVTDERIAPNRVPDPTIILRSHAQTWDVPDNGSLAQLRGTFAVPATVFSHDLEVFKIKLTARGESPGANFVSAKLVVLGDIVADPFLALPASTRLVEEAMTLFDVDANFNVMGIPITVGASADGTLYVDATASFDNLTLAGSLVPGANVDLTARAGIGGYAGGVGASAGVSGTATLVDVSQPATLSAEIAPDGIAITENVALNITGLDGHIDLYVEGCLGALGCQSASKEIFDWTGMTFANLELFNLSQHIDY